MGDLLLAHSKQAIELFRAGDLIFHGIPFPASQLCHCLSLRKKLTAAYQLGGSLLDEFLEMIAVSLQLNLGQFSFCDVVYRHQEV